MNTTIRDAVLASIGRAVNRPVTELDEDMDLLGLGLDSLAFSEILVDVEDALGAEVPAEVLDRLSQLGDIVTTGDILQLLSGWDVSSPFAASGLVVTVDALA